VGERGRRPVDKFVLVAFATLADVDAMPATTAPPTSSASVDWVQEGGLGLRDWYGPLDSPAESRPD